MSTPAPLHQVPSARQLLPPQTSLPRHRHLAPYAAVVIAGSYEEAGDQGRRVLMPGDVALHDAFSAHLNRVGKQGARLVNLPATTSGERFARVHDLDRLIRVVAVDRTAASYELQAQLQPLPPTLQDWPDLLARDLSLTPHLLLADWARARGLAPETLSRSFAKVFGATPRRWRFELRTRNALRAVLLGRESLVGAALDSGFADQAHLTHAVVAMTGRPPGHWRRHVKSRQDM
jgi:AraC-like DNA-binding protein